VTPIPKKGYLKEIKDTRKITCLSDFGKIYEGFLKTWILEDISKKKVIVNLEGRRV
jgi:hypothetical protein